MILSDRTITERLERGDLKVTPLADNAVQPASVDLRLDARLLIAPEEFWACPLLLGAWPVHPWQHG